MNDRATVGPGAAKVTSPLSKQGIFDCDIHPVLKKSADIRGYLSPAWHDYYDKYMHFVTTPYKDASAYPKSAPAVSRRDAWPPNGGGPGSDLAFMREQHLDPLNVECGILQPLFPMASRQRNVDFAAAMCAAVNDWQLAEWSSQEPRLKASIVIPQESGEASVAEIERWKDHLDFAQILLMPRTDEPLGRRRYWPIYEAANKYGIPVGIHGGGPSGRPSTAAGHPSFHIEDYQSQPAAMQALVSSLVLEGVFERFPDVKFVLIEAGIGWVPSIGWRLDKIWARQRSEVPHLTRRPSDYIKSNFWFTTQPIDEPEKPEQLRDVIDWVGWDRILFATDYPHWDSDDPRYAFKCRLSNAESDQIFRGNARGVYKRVFVPKEGRPS